MKHILILVDGSTQSGKAVDQGLEIATAFHSRVTLIHVMPLAALTWPGVGKESMIYEVTEKNAAQSNELLLEAKQRFDRKNHPVEIVSAFGDAADEILDYVADHDVDWIILGDRDRGTFAKRSFFAEDRTTKILYHIDVPVLVVK